MGSRYLFVLGYVQFGEGQALGRPIVVDCLLVVAAVWGGAVAKVGSGLGGIGCLLFLSVWPVPRTDGAPKTGSALDDSVHPDAGKVN